MTRAEIIQTAKPILFNTEMVQAILDGRKTVTRRCVKYKYSNTEMKMHTDKYGTRLIEKEVEGETFRRNEDGSAWPKLGGYIEPKPPYQPRDVLYVRETHYWLPCYWCGQDMEGGSCNPTKSNYNSKKGECGCYQYRADCEDTDAKWTPSIHMPKEAARIWLKVTDVRVERLQEISGEELLKEGIDKSLLFDGPVKNAFNAFSELWDSTIKKTDLALYGWEANPWVWIIEFERCEKPAT